MDKFILREEAKRKRSSLPHEVKMLKDKLILTHLKEFISNESRESLNIALYASKEDEINTDPIFKVLKDKHFLFYPRISEHRQMEFYPVYHLGQLVISKFFIREPIIDIQYPIHPKNLDILILPMLAFNQKGYRLGYGQGYYDRYLAKHDLFVIGLAYHELCVDVSFEESHDIACDLIITEKGIEVENKI